MNKVSLDNIITKLASISSISDDIGGRIYDQTPINTDQEGIYIIVSLVGDPVDTIVSKQAIIGIRVVAHTRDVKLSKLYEIINNITENIVNTSVGDDYGFGVYKVIEQPIAPAMEDEQGRFELIKDYLFNFTQ